jgi:CheY-like chemotaxis protein/anti-sigma regulatory factor (Ser/Thr protein kinase)
MRAEQKGLVFVYKPLSYLPTAVNTDEKRLRQILINLLGNAVKFTEKGGITFKVGYHNNDIRFQVEDTGIGIAPEELDRVFLPFQQVEERLSKTEGTGLGLTISKALVETMGGKLHIESELGRGSTFWTALNLPVVEHWLEKESFKQPVITGFQPPAQKILLIDDKWENRSVLVSLLTELGFIIAEAIHGQEALDKLPEFAPHLILADLVMPVMDGFEFIRQLRRLPQFKTIPVIAVSASAFDFQKQRSFEAGFDDFMTKPIHVEALLKSVQHFLQLDWIYQSPADVFAPKSPAVTTTLESTALMKLPAKQAAGFLDSALRGDFQKILRQVEQLEQTTPELSYFTEKIRQAAKRFDDNQICELVKPYVEKPL